MSQKKFNVWFFDLECLWSIHTASFKNRDTGEKKQFVLHPLRNDIYEYMSFLGSLLPTPDQTSVLLGFNIMNYDYPVLYYIMNDLQKYRKDFDNPANVISLIYKKSIEVMNNRWSSISEWHTQIPLVDPYKINHYDNPAKRTSLKYIEGVLRMPIIEQYEDFDKEVKTLEEIEELLFYNDYDNEAAEKFYYETLDDIKQRQDLTKQYRINLMNADDPKLGSELLLNDISILSNIEVSELKKMRTFRGEVPLKDCILPFIKFNTPEFNYILERLKRSYTKEKVLSNNGVNITVHNYDNFYKTNPYKVKNIKIKIDSPDTKIYIEHLNCAYIVGIGGIHGITHSGRYKECNEYMIIDTDVGSFYPALASEHNFSPAHFLPYFPKVYGGRYKYRISIKHIKEKKSEAGGWKLGLNGVSGLGHSGFSPFYDMKFPLDIRINGQLLLLMLIEDTILNLDCQILQINTDGFTMKLNRKQYDQYMLIAKKWEQLTKLNLEFDEFKEIGLADVNNYYAIKKGDNLKPSFPKTDWYDNYYSIHKVKGRYQVIPEANGKIAYHKSWDHRIVQMAVYDYFIHGKNIKDTIKNCTNILDFCNIYKSNSTYKTIYINPDGREEEIGKVTRYYVSSGGGALKKVRKKKLKKDEKGSNEGRIEAGYSITLFNEVIQHDDFSKYNIDYTYYIREANKLVSAIEQPEQLTLNVF